MSGVNIHTENMLRKILADYKRESTGVNTDENIELEIKLKNINKNSFESIYKSCVSSKDFSKPKLERSINIINTNPDEKFQKGKLMDLKQIIRFIYGDVTKVDYEEKSSLVRPVFITDHINYSVALAKERKITKKAPKSNAYVRFKARASFELFPLSDSLNNELDETDTKTVTSPMWRIDLTAVRSGTLNDFNNSLKVVKNEFLPDRMDEKNYLDILKDNLIDNYEIEIEHIGQDKNIEPEEIYSIIKYVFTLINEKYAQEIIYHDEIYHIADYIFYNKNILDLFKNKYGLKKLANQVISLTKNEYYNSIFPPEDYYLTDKADGKRVIISCNGNRCRIMFSNHFIEFCDGAFTPGEITLLDAEVLEKNNKITAYCFDAMYIRDEDISKNPFETRLTYLEDACNIVNKYFKKKDKYECKVKNYIKLTGDLEKGFKEIYYSKLPYEIDGLIITEPGKSYYKTKNYKWKPYDKNTIDFMVVKCPSNLIGYPPYTNKKDHTLHLLFVGINKEVREKIGMGFIPHYENMFKHNYGSYFPIQFSPSANPLAYLYQHPIKEEQQDIDNRIIELSRDAKNKNWIFNKIRDDRKIEDHYFGNDFKVAEYTYSNYIDPFNFDDLYEMSDRYFTKVSSDIYVAPNKFKRYVISTTLKNNLSNSKWVIDLAAGRGGDLHRYNEIGIENGLFIDIDPTAISELIKRKFSFFAIKKQQVKRGGNDSIQYDKLFVKDVKTLTVHTLVKDLKAPEDELIASIYQFGIKPGHVDGIVCNFAFHYMCDTVQNIRNLLTFVVKTLKVGGLFLFTVLDGESVFKLLENYKINEQWESREGPVLKYAIKKKYSSNKLTDAGQLISILLPLADEMYDEPLCNLKYVAKEAKALGLEVEINESMGDSFDEYRRKYKSIADKLTDEDKKYVSLHKIITFKLKKEFKDKK